MPDVLGYRANIGVVVPSTNTTMEPELYAMAPAGVTFHTARMYVPQPALGSPAEAEAFFEAIFSALDLAVRDVTTIQPDHLIVGMSSIALMGGMDGHRQLKARVEQRAQCSVTTAADAADAALALHGAQRIGLLSPHPPMTDAHYARFLAETGRELVRQHRIDCPTSLAIARVDQATTRAALLDLDGPDIDAILQVGTDLVMAGLADEAERWLGKPVLAANPTMLWHTLRAKGIPDQIKGFGTLLREH